MSRSRARVVLAGAPAPAGSAETVGVLPPVAVARALRDAGHEVVYAGPVAEAARLAAAAVQEDADLVGLCLAEGPSPLTAELAGELAVALERAGAREVEVFVVGGEPPPGAAAGLAAGSSAAEVAAWVTARRRERDRAE